MATEGAKVSTVASTPTATALLSEGAPGASDERGAFVLEKSRRLLRRRDFVRVQRRGARGGAMSVVLIARKVREGRGRVGFTVSKAVGRAHVRNLVKRRLRHIMRERPALFVALDLVVLAKPEAATRSFDKLAADVERAHARLLEALASGQRGRPKSNRAQKGRGKGKKGQSRGQKLGKERTSAPTPAAAEPASKPRKKHTSNGARAIIERLPMRP